MAERGIDLIGPAPDHDVVNTNRQKAYQYRGVRPDYAASEFRYDPSTNTYMCPEGKRLTYDAKDPRAGTMRYRYKAAATDCHACPAKPFCCPRTRHGRSIQRSEPLPAIAAFRDKMQTDTARAIYKTRSQIAEFPNLWIKAKLGLRQFRVRGLAKVSLECLWAALTYDIQHWIRLRGRGSTPAAITP
jgi:Transposase DDE domain